MLDAETGLHWGWVQNGKRILPQEHGWQFRMETCRV